MASHDEQLAHLIKQNEELKARLAEVQQAMKELELLVRGYANVRPDLRLLEGGEDHTD